MIDDQICPYCDARPLSSPKRPTCGTIECRDEHRRKKATERQDNKRNRDRIAKGLPKRPVGRPRTKKAKK